MLDLDETPIAETLVQVRKTLPIPFDPDIYNLPRICPQPGENIHQTFNVCMPHFIIYGGMKCGTTSLYEYLGEHPDILHVKDGHHFFPKRIQKQMAKQVELLTQEDKKWLFRDYAFRDFSQIQKKLLPEKVLPLKSKLKSESKKIKKALVKLMRPIIGAKEVRYFGPSHFKWSTYFAEDFDDPFQWYVDSFPTIPIDHGTDYERNYHKISGEASPTYLAGNEIVADRIKHFLPDAKLIILLRNPVERFLSMQRMKSGMKEEIDKVRKQEGKNIRRPIMSLDEMVEVSDAGPYKDESLTKNQKTLINKVNRDLKASLYADKIRKILSKFSSEQVLVIQSEYFYDKTVEVMHDVEEFLGIPHQTRAFWENITSHIYNLVINGTSREFTPLEGKQSAKIEINNQTRLYLREYFRESNTKLADMLGMKFEGWDYQSPDS